MKNSIKLSLLLLAISGFLFLSCESLDGKSSACENIREFYKVTKRQSDLDKTTIKKFINKHNKNISKK